jgi:alpha-N-arabinofuranosidase
MGHDGSVELAMRAPALAPFDVPSVPSRDDFDAPELRLEYAFLRNPRPTSWSLTRRRGFLSLVGSEVSLDDVGSPAFVGRRQQHEHMRFGVELQFDPDREGEEAGITVRAREDAHYDLAVDRGPSGREAFLRSRVNGESRTIRRVAIGDGPVRLWIRSTESRYALSVESRGQDAADMGELPCAALSAETLTKSGRFHFTGAFLGMYATGRGRTCRSSADFDWCEYAEDRDAAVLPPDASRD